VREVAIDGNANGTIIITGDGNKVSLSAQSELFYHPLDEAFREVQSTRAPADFYNGTRPNWANIAQQHDANRHLLDDLLQFAADPNLPPQRMGIITGLSGEGKTTLLMRAAWKLAENGHTVMWRHFGKAFEPYHLPLTDGGKLIICFDEITYVEQLPEIISDLHESGLPFIVLGSARVYDWENSDFRSDLARLVRPKEFRLDRLENKEVEDLLERLEKARALGSLENLSPNQRVRYFLDRLNADGQLLPALITARRGQSFDQILGSIFEHLKNRYRSEPEKVRFLLKGYAGIALVHRFNFWITRPLLAEFIGLDEDQIGFQLMRPLQGELLEISEGEDRHLFTRHPWIAEAALGLLEGKYLPEDYYLYQDLYRALGSLLQSNSFFPERKLLTMLPLAFKRRGDIKKAIQLFMMATEADPRHAPSFQAWALMEKDNRNFDRARELFRKATEADQGHAFAYQAWALMEAQNGDQKKALPILEKGLQLVSKQSGKALILSTMGGLCARQNDFAKAKEYFIEALRLHKENPLTHYHFAVDCLLPIGNREQACQHLRLALELRPRKIRDQEKYIKLLRNAAINIHSSNLAVHSPTKIQSSL